MSGRNNQPGSPDAGRPRRHARSADAEQAILAATEELLARTTLHELSVAQIITAAGISRATFYFYFSSKFAVLTALVDRVIAEIVEVGRSSLDLTGELPAAVALRRRIEASAAIWEANRAVLQATVENWYAVPELRTVWLGALGRLSAGLAQELDRDRAHGRAPAGPDSAALAATLVWTTERCLYVAGLDLRDSPADTGATVDALVRIWLGALYGGDADGHAAAA